MAVPSIWTLGEEALTEDPQKHASSNARAIGQIDRWLRSDWMDGGRDLYGVPARQFVIAYLVIPTWTSA
jgi:hypothetical protein